MTYEEAKVFKQELEEKNTVASDMLKKFNSEKNSMGITPDHIRALPEWKNAKEQFERSFNELRNFNSWFVKTFKNEIAADRRKRYQNR